MSSPPPPTSPPNGGRLAALTLLALGIVFGDIGTSPLYAVRQCFAGPHGVAVTPDNVLGILSLVVWSLVLVVCVKYLAVVMLADNKGEGGILALLTHLGAGFGEKRRRYFWVLTMAGLLGAALLYGDGMITPAISVLSAVEGVKVATPQLGPWVIPITVAILIGLFALQMQGSTRIGAVFGPVMLVWFLTIGTLGVVQIARAPEILLAANPLWAIRFFLHNGVDGFLVLGAVFLVVTGGEALYMDMGHFGLRPIRTGWYCLVLPALLANYLGQGALLLLEPAKAVNPFYSMAPAWALYPLVALAATAAVIASQALISGIFSLTMQAIQIGLSPRLHIEHTSASHRGQVFVGTVNWLLMLSSIGLVIGFRDATSLANAYGVAVTGTMVITTVLFGAVTRRRWGWSAPRTWLIVGGFLLIDLAFFGANLAKVPHGGWFPLIVGAVIFTLFSTWRRGRALVGERLSRSVRPLTTLLKAIRYDPPTRVPGTAVFMTGNPDGVPLALLHNLLHNKVLHNRVVLLSIQFQQVPYVAEEERVQVEELEEGFHRVVAKFGYMEDPDVPKLLMACVEHGLRVKAGEATFFLGRESLAPRPHKKGFPLWRQRLFAFMARNSQPAVSYFRIPPNRVIEVGQQIEL